METANFLWVWKIDIQEYVGQMGEAVFLYVGSVQGFDKITGDKFCEFRTTKHRSADKAHEELMSIIERTENTVYDQNQL